MSDEKPKGLDLSKLLKKKVAASADASEKPANAQPADAAEAPPKKALDLAKLLKKKAPEPLLEAEPAPVIVESPTAPAKAPPAKTLATPLEPTPPQPASRESKAPKPAPMINVAKTAQVSTVIADQGTTPFKASVEEAASREGAKALKLDVTVAEARKYPLGYYGINELDLNADREMETLARHIYRLRDHQDGFAIGYRITGAAYANYGVIWDGKQLSDRIGSLPRDPTVVVTHDADTIIDLVRGHQSCTTFRNLGTVEGDESLLYWLGVDIYAGYDATVIEILVEQEEKERRACARVRSEASDPIAAVLGLCELAAQERVQSIVEPLLVRCFFPGRVEALLHFEAQKLTVMRGKPGETLVQGALELSFDAKAVSAMAEGEANLSFLLLARRVTCSGDLGVLSECGLITNPIALGYVRHVHKTGAPIGPSNRLPKTVCTVGPSKDPYLNAV